MSLELITAREIKFPRRLTRDLAEKWADEIPLYPVKDPRNPEWKATPVIVADLTPYGYGKVLIKDEGSSESNPTGTIKDRLARELAKLYGRFARAAMLRTKNGLGKSGIETVTIPRFSVITSGNVATAVAHAFEEFGLPPVKVLIDNDTPEDRVRELMRHYADVYVADLSGGELSAADIKRATNNVSGVDITSSVAFRPDEVLYDWHAHEVLNLEPDLVFVPYGSGRIFENYLRWQERSLTNETEGRRDLRLQAPIEKVIATSILGAEPRRRFHSKADKLTARYKPFAILRDGEIRDLKAFKFTGRDTGVYRVDERRIDEAYDVMNGFCDAEYSGAAGLGLYMQLFDQGRIDPRAKVIIVNSGRGI